MSYARWGADGSHVYVFLAIDGWLECCMCRLTRDYRATSTAGMMAHLDQHRAAGETVPDDTYAQLREDADENDEWIASVRP